jgi:hypothetical protein
MGKTAGVVIVIALLAAPAAAQKVHVDYDRDAVGKEFKSFAWAPTPETSLAKRSPLMHSRIKNAIEYYITRTGAVEDDEHPDIYVTYHTDSEHRVSYDTSSFGYGYGPGWTWDPTWGGAMTTGTTTDHTYERGTLIVDIWDAREKKLVWRGSATAVVPQNPETGARLIDRMLEKMVAKYDKMRKKDQKRQRTAVQ